MAEYLIQDTTLTAFANQMRRLSNTNASMTTLEILEMLSKVNGSISENGDYLARAYGYNSLLKSRNVDSGQIFVLPTDISVPDGYRFCNWDSSAPITNHFITATDNNIEANIIIDTISGATEFDIVIDNIEEEVRLPLESDATKIDWGDGNNSYGPGLNDSTTYHRYLSTGMYTIKVYGATKLNQNLYGGQLPCTSIRLSNSIVSIGSSTFGGQANLINIIIPYGLRIIGSSAFNSCINLQNITLPRSIASIGKYAFLGCDILTEIKYLGSEEEFSNIDIDSSDLSLTSRLIFTG